MPSARHTGEGVIQPSAAEAVDDACAGLEMMVTARREDPAQLVVKAKDAPGVSVSVEDDEFAS